MAQRPRIAVDSVSAHLSVAHTSALRAIYSMPMVTMRQFGIEQVCSYQTFDGKSYHPQGFYTSKLPIELQRLFRSDRKRPDGLTLVPWTHGRAPRWDYTCVHRLASSYSQFAGRERTYCGRCFRVTKKHQIKDNIITAHLPTN